VRGDKQTDSVHQEGSQHLAQPGDFCKSMKAACAWTSRWLQQLT
jgi:hypothetical protein